MGIAAGGVMLVVWIFLLILAVLWFLMPFAVFGSKDLLKKLIEEQRRTNKLLEEAAERARAPAASLVSSKYRDG